MDCIVLDHKTPRSSYRQPERVPITDTGGPLTVLELTRIATSLLSVVGSLGQQVERLEAIVELKADRI